MDGGGPDLEQSREFVRRLGLELFLEPIDVRSDEVCVEDAILAIEDYKPLDVQSAAMAPWLRAAAYAGATLSGKYLLDGDGHGDENLKDYPIEDNPELTIRSDRNNPLLYQEGGASERSSTR